MQITFFQNTTGYHITGRQAAGLTPHPEQIEIQLKQDDVLRLNKNRRAVTLRSTAGVLWVTREGDDQDYMLRAGEGVSIRQDKVVLVQALGAGVVEVISE